MATYQDLINQASRLGYGVGEGEMAYGMPQAGQGAGYTGLTGIPGGKAYYNPNWYGGSFVWTDPNRPDWMQGIGAGDVPIEYRKNEKVDPWMFAPFAAAAGAAALAGGGAASGAGVASGATGAGAGVGLGGGAATAGAAGAGGVGASGGLLSGLSSVFGGSGGGGAMSGLLGNKAIGALAGGLLGGVGGSSQSGNQTVTTQQMIDPRLAPYIYGDNGMVPRIMGALDTQQKPGIGAFGQAADQYLGRNGANDLESMRASANGLLSSNISAPTASAVKINAPSQNTLNLKPAYQDMVYGAAGANPYLTGAIQKGINQSNTAFGNMMSDATRNLTQSILPSIRSGARVSGSYGGDREGIAQGQALDTFNTQMGRAMSQFGQNNTDAAVSAQAGAYDADRNRALSAMSGLGAQQYGVAQQQAQLDMQRALANQQAQLGTNALNSSNKVAGLGVGSGLLNQAYGIGTNNDSYDISKLGKVSGLLTPYTGLGGSSSTTSPLYENKTAGLLGGAMAGMQLANMFGGSSGGAGGYNPGAQNMYFGSYNPFN